MKSSFLLLFLLVGSLSTTLDQRAHPIMQIEIYFGLTEWGEQALLLTHEGLILRQSPIPGKRRIKFVRLDEINPKELYALNDFLTRHDCLKQLNSEYVHETNTMFKPRKYVLRSYDDDYIRSIIDQDYFRYIVADFGDRLLMDSLVILTNNVIPPKLRDKYSISEFSKTRKSMESK